jgi:hypothetical protein
VEYKIGMEKRLVVMTRLWTFTTVALSTYKQSAEGRKVDATKGNMPAKSEI